MLVVDRSLKLVELEDLSSTVAVDTETTGTNYWHGDRPYAFSFCDDRMRYAYFRWEVDPATRKVRVRVQDRIRMRRFFANTQIRKIFWNNSFDQRMLEVSDMPVLGRIEDAMYAAHVCNNLENNYKLKVLSEKYVGVSRLDETELQKATNRARHEARKANEAAGKVLWLMHEKVQPDYWMAPKWMLRRYALYDVKRTMLLWMMYRDVMKEEELLGTYRTEMALNPIVYSIMGRGVRCDQEIVASEIVKHERGYKEVDAEIKKVAPGVNLNSPKQLKNFLYGTGPKQLGLIAVVDKHGKVSTAFKARIKLKHPFIGLLNKFRSHEKALSTFFYKYRRESVACPLSVGEFCLHPDFQQLGPVTGRFSCRNPNLQNVANALTTRSTEPIQARMPFGPRKGFVWYHFDFSQLEVRIFADFAQELFMLKALNDSGRDLHAECANKVWGTGCKERGDFAPAFRAAGNALGLDGSGHASDPKVVEQVKRLCKLAGVQYQTAGTIYNQEVAERIAKRWLDEFKWDIVAAEKSIDKKNRRTSAKWVLFLKVFGGGPKALMDTIGCGLNEAKTLLADYDTAFPRIPAYMNELTKEARRQGYIRNAYNRRLMIDPDKVYRCVNYRVQSSAADLVKDRMIALEKMLVQGRSCGVEAYQVLTIHDEIVVEIKKGCDTPGWVRSVKTLLEDHTGHFGTPLTVEVDRVVKMWSEKEKVEIA